MRAVVRDGILLQVVCLSSPLQDLKPVCPRLQPHNQLIVGLEAGAYVSTLYLWVDGGAVLLTLTLTLTLIIRALIGLRRHTGTRLPSGKAVCTSAPLCFG